MTDDPYERFGTDPEARVRGRAAEDAEFERRRRQQLQYLAADMFAQSMGQADWQRFRRDNPLGFLRAKLDIQGGPPGLGTPHLEFSWDDRSTLWIVFEWQKGPNVAWMSRGLSFREITRDEDGRFLADSARWLAREVARASGVATEIRVRGNRAAYEWHEAHKNDAPAARPRLAPARKRLGGSICGLCRAKFDDELVDFGGFSAGLPCGHGWDNATYETVTEPAGVVEVIP